MLYTLTAKAINPLAIRYYNVLINESSPRRSFFLDWLPSDVLMLWDIFDFLIKSSRMIDDLQRSQSLS